MIENSYNPDHFLIELTDGKGYTDHINASIDAKSAYLHEYIHYLQDTATYYGAMLRSECILGNTNKDVIGASVNELFLPLCFGKLYIEDDRVYFEDTEKLQLGSLALKESMAQEAQRYVFGEKSVSSCSTVLYRGIKTIIDRALPSVSNFPLLRFVIEECCLMTTNPVSSLLTLITKLQNNDIAEILSENAEEPSAEMLHQKCETILENNSLLSYNTISAFDNAEISLQRNTLSKVASVLFTSQQDMVANFDRHQKAYKHIETFRQDNLSKRIDDHFVIVRTLILYKQTLDITTWHSEFGFPMVRYVNNAGITEINEIDFSN